MELRCGFFRFFFFFGWFFLFFFFCFFLCFFCLFFCCGGKFFFFLFYDLCFPPPLVLFYNFTLHCLSASPPPGWDLCFPDKWAFAFSNWLSKRYAWARFPLISTESSG